ncbi:MAG: hypothetical protein OXB91_03455 [Bryobacterales bacterium]|nr:hypothetical protein [Bryobacterales bacterium]
MPLGSVLIPIAFFAMIVVVVWLGTGTWRRVTDRRAELIRQLIDKFSTGEAFAQAMQSPEGSKLADALSLSREQPKRAWVGLFVPGSILTALGLGFVLLSFMMDVVYRIPAVVIGSVGVALLVSSYVAWRVDRDDRDESGEGDDVIAPQSTVSGPDAP